MSRRPVHPVTTPARQGGASLLEVLVAILIMSFGLLAFAGLTAASQQYVKTAQFQAIAMQSASELGERMRGNVSGFQNGSYTKTTAYSDGAVEVPECPASGCTASDRAAIELAQWLQELRLRLPGGDAFVQRDAANKLVTDIWILWIDPAIESVAGAGDCPAAALSGVPNSAPPPRCMYYRISL